MLVLGVDAEGRLGHLACPEQGKLAAINAFAMPRRGPGTADGDVLDQTSPATAALVLGRD